MGAYARRLPRSRHLPVFRFGGKLKAKLTFQLCVASSLDENGEVGGGKAVNGVSDCHHGFARAEQGDGVRVATRPGEWVSRLGG